MNSTAHPRMHILIATDGSEQATAAARFVRGLANPATVGRVTVLATIRPLTSAPFFTMAAVSQDAWNSLNEAAESAAQNAVQTIVNVLDGFVPQLDTVIRNGS